MRLFYTVAYAVGFRPWETAAKPEVQRKLFDREEAERIPPLGKALDLGCGTGIHAIELARRGWQVTGIDMVPKALRQAEERARKAGANIKFVRGDVTDLRRAEVGGGFDFALDFGLFHGLDDHERLAMGHELTSVSKPGATLLMMAFAPGRRGLLPRGASRADIERAFSGWTVIADEPAPADRLPRPLRNAQPKFYRLRLRGPAP